MLVNEGTLDRGLRVLLGSTLLWIGTVSGILEGTLGTAAVALGGALLLTGIVGVCGIYKLVGINTCGREG